MSSRAKDVPSGWLRVEAENIPARSSRTYLSRPGWAAFGLLSLLVLVSPAVPLADAYLPVYDERRVLLIVFMSLCGILCYIRRFLLTVPLLAPLSLIAALGLLSTLSAASVPAHALTEVALFMLTISACLLLGTACPTEKDIRSFLLPCLAGSGIFYGIVTLVTWAAGWAVEGHQPPWPEPIHNFINRRFMNDWQTWLLPLLPALLFARVPLCRPALHQTLTIAYFALLWALLLYSLGRATLYAQLGCVLLIPLLFGRIGLRWSGLQLAAALLGLLLLIFAFGMNPFGTSGAGAPTDRLMTFESPGRIMLWTLSWELIRENPLVGIGPMQFAAIPGHLHAHPHSFPLQIAVEWGIPAAVLLAGSLIYAAWKWLCFARARAGDPQCPPWEAFLLMSLTGSIAAASANSLLAGTAVTPMSQLMLILVVGLGCALYRRGQPAIAKRRQHLAKAWCAATLAAAIWLAGFTTYEISRYTFNDVAGTRAAGGGWYPRYWRQGRLLHLLDIPAEDAGRANDEQAARPER